MEGSREAIIDAARRRARENYSTGFNCAESVVEAALGTVHTGLPPEVLKLATGFGGGIGLYGDTCGALTGAVLACGAVHGRIAPPEGPDRRARIAASRVQMHDDPGLYRLFHQLPGWFRQRFGHTLCRELTAPWRADWACRERGLHCREIVTETAGRAIELMLLEVGQLRDLTFLDTIEK